MCSSQLTQASSVACSLGVSSGDGLEDVTVEAGGNGPNELAVVIGPSPEAEDGARPMLVKKAISEETEAWIPDSDGATVGEGLAI